MSLSPHLLPLPPCIPGESKTLMWGPKCGICSGNLGMWENGGIGGDLGTWQLGMELGDVRQILEHGDLGT